MGGALSLKERGERSHMAEGKRAARSSELVLPLQGAGEDRWHDFSR